MYETFSVRTAMLHLVLSAFPISVVLLVLAACCCLLLASAPPLSAGLAGLIFQTLPVRPGQSAASQNDCVDAPPSCCRTPPQSEPEHTPPLKIPSL